VDRGRLTHPPFVATARTEFLGGVKGGLRILLGVIPFGMIYGVLAIGAGLPSSAAQAMSSIVFAGSAQFVATQLFKVGTPGVILVVTTLVVNLRHMLYSASLAPYLKHLNWKWKCLLAYLLTDEAYAVAITHYLDAPAVLRNAGGTGATEAAAPLPPNLVGTDAGRSAITPPRIGGQVGYLHWYFLGAGLGLWLSWQISTVIGILLGAQIPSAWALDFTLALTFIALVVPALKDHASVVAALSAGVVAVAAASWPYRLGLMAAALTGIIVGLLVEMRQVRSYRLEQEQSS
jgi:predicted branched-subunit amino acid permease